MQADDGFARAIYPSHTMGDGDTVFSLATGQWTGEVNLTCTDDVPAGPGVRCPKYIQNFCRNIS